MHSSWLLLHAGYAKVDYQGGLVTLAITEVKNNHKIWLQIAGSVECVYHFECIKNMPHDKELAALEKCFLLC